MLKNRTLWLDLLEELEGGYVDHPDDPGGKTNLGVTQETLAAWRKKPVTEADVRALTREEARDIFTALYWQAVKGDELPGGLDCAVADFAVNSGPARAVKTLQALLDVEQDGVLGSVTLAACRAITDTAALIRRYMMARLAFLEGLKTWPTFGKGWLNRCEKVQRVALELVEANALEAKVPQAAVTTGGIVAVVMLLVEMLPTLIKRGQEAHEAASAGDWSAMAVAAAVAIGAALGGLTRYRAWRAARPV